MRCDSCQTNEVPKYNIDRNKNETINCCCETFARVLQDRINNRGNATKNIEFTIDYSSTKQNKDDDFIKWELVNRKTKRWDELGFGDGDRFPGYGKIYDREFLAWYCDVGSKERKNIQEFKDRFPLNYRPRDSEKVVGKQIDFDQLQNKKEFEVLFSGLDKENRKRWHFGLLKKTPTGIETDRAQEKECEENKIVETPWIEKVKTVKIQQMPIKDGETLFTKRKHKIYKAEVRPQKEGYFEQDKNKQILVSVVAGSIDEALDSLASKLGSERRSTDYKTKDYKSECGKWDDGSRYFIKIISTEKYKR